MTFIKASGGSEMTLGERIRRLRHEGDWSQTQLAQKLGVHQKQISGYERDVHTPSTEVLIRIAELFDVSLDFLAFDDRPDVGARSLIADRELVEKLAAIDRLSERDKETVKAVLGTFILTNCGHRAGRSGFPPPSGPPRTSSTPPRRSCRTSPAPPTRR